MTVFYFSSSVSTEYNCKNIDLPEPEAHTAWPFWSQRFLVLTELLKKPTQRHLSALDNNEQHVYFSFPKDNRG